VTLLDCNSITVKLIFAFDIHFVNSDKDLVHVDKEKKGQSYKFSEYFRVAEIREVLTHKARDITEGVAQTSLILSVMKRSRLS
jgi:hypothetical protein